MYSTGFTRKSGSRFINSTESGIKKPESGIKKPRGTLTGARERGRSRMHSQRIRHPASRSARLQGDRHRMHLALLLGASDEESLMRPHSLATLFDLKVLFACAGTGSTPSAASLG